MNEEERQRRENLRIMLAEAMRVAREEAARLRAEAERALDKKPDR